MYEPITKKFIISKDVSFEEKKSWKWEENTEEENVIEIFGKEDQMATNYEGEDPNAAEERESNAEAGKNDKNGEQRESSMAEQGISKSTAGRIIQKPVWMKDYECGEKLGMIIEEDGEEIIVMFLAEEDPEKFEDAVKEKKWRRAMEAEIKPTEENNTWELVELPPGAKAIGVK